MFRKYPEIENLCNNKKIKSFVKHNPYCEHNSYIYQLKYDGSNIQLIFEPDAEMQIGKRSSILPEEENFNGILDIIDRYNDVIDYLGDYADLSGNTVNVYGEIYGQGIQRRIDYGPDKYIRFFDVAVNGQMLTYKETKELFTFLVEEYYAETYGPEPFNRIFNLSVPEGHEGIVIKPYSMVDRDERQLRLKLKDEKFKEKGGKTKSKSKEKDPMIEEVESKLLPFITENRVKSVFSKEGEIEEENQIGKYISFVMDDALNDFLKEEDISHISKSQFKKVKKNVTPEIVSILKGYL